MRVIVCGGGQVGYNIASYLSRENNEVTVVDINAELVANINRNLEANGIVGHASDPAVLSRAGAGNADMIIAVTHQDEINMVACQVAHSLFNVPKKIARIRRQTYLEPAWSNLFSRAHMPIDIIISPEREVANTLLKWIEVPGTSYVVPLIEDRVYFIGLVCDEACPLLNTPLHQLMRLFPNLSLKIVAIVRDGIAIIPKTGEEMCVGDEIYFLVDAKHLDRAMQAFGHEEKEAHNVVIVGGGHIGTALAEVITESHRNINLKIIEKDPVCAERLSEKMENALVLEGDGVDRALQDEVNIEQTDTIVTVTNDDESNILSALLAKNNGCKRAISLVNNENYMPLMNTLNIDAFISPRQVTVSTIMRHIRRGRIKGIYSLKSNFAELIEAEASENCPIINTPIKDLNMPRTIVIGAVMRNDEIMIPDGDFVIHAGDRVAILAAEGQARKVEKLFSVQIEI